MMRDGMHELRINHGKKKEWLGRYGYVGCSFTMRLAQTVAIQENYLDRVRAIYSAASC